jgi:hypothetical protein
MGVTREGGEVAGACARVIMAADKHTTQNTTSVR